MTREIARLRDLVRELMEYRENNDVDDAVTAKIEDAMRECAADIGWFESVLAADATKMVSIPWRSWPQRFWRPSRRC